MYDIFMSASLSRNANVRCPISAAGFALVVAFSFLLALPADRSANACRSFESLEVGFGDQTAAIDDHLKQWTDTVEQAEAAFINAHAWVAMLMRHGATREVVRPGHVSSTYHWPAERLEAAYRKRIANWGEALLEQSDPESVDSLRAAVVAKLQSMIGTTGRNANGVSHNLRDLCAEQIDRFSPEMLDALREHEAILLSRLVEVIRSFDPEEIRLAMRDGADSKYASVVSSQERHHAQIRQSLRVVADQLINLADEDLRAPLQDALYEALYPDVWGPFTAEAKLEAVVRMNSLHGEALNDVMTLLDQVETEKARSATTVLSKLRTFDAPDRVERRRYVYHLARFQYVHPLPGPDETQLEFVESLEAHRRAMEQWDDRVSARLVELGVNVAGLSLRRNPLAQEEMRRSQHASNDAEPTPAQRLLDEVGLLLTDGGARDVAVLLVRDFLGKSTIIETIEVSPDDVSDATADLIPGDRSVVLRAFNSEDAGARGIAIEFVRARALERAFGKLVSDVSILVPSDRMDDWRRVAAAYFWDVSIRHASAFLPSAFNTMQFDVANDVAEQVVRANPQLEAEWRGKFAKESLDALATYQSDVSVARLKYEVAKRRPEDQRRQSEIQAAFDNWSSTVGRLTAMIDAHWQAMTDAGGDDVGDRITKELERAQFPHLFIDTPVDVLLREIEHAPHGAHLRPEMEAIRARYRQEYAEVIHQTVRDIQYWNDPSRLKEIEQAYIRWMEGKSTFEVQLGGFSPYAERWVIMFETVDRYCDEIASVIQASGLEPDPAVGFIVDWCARE